MVLFGPGQGQAERRGAVLGTSGAVRAPLESAHLRPGRGRGRSPGSCGNLYVRLHHRRPPDRCPHLGTAGPHLGLRLPQGTARPGPAAASAHRGVAVGPAERRHQDP